MVSFSGAVLRQTKQSAKAVRGPHGQQRSTATKVVYITCAPMCFADNALTNRTTHSGGGRDGNCCCKEGKKLRCKYVCKKLLGKYLGRHVTQAQIQS